MVAPDKKTLKKSVKSMFFMVQTRCEVETIKYWQVQGRWYASISALFLYSYIPLVNIAWQGHTRKITKNGVPPLHKTPPTRIKGGVSAWWRKEEKCVSAQAARYGGQKIKENGNAYQSEEKTVKKNRCCMVCWLPCSSGLCCGYSVDIV